VLEPKNTSKAATEPTPAILIDLLATPKRISADRLNWIRAGGELTTQLLDVSALPGCRKHWSSSISVDLQATGKATGVQIRCRPHRACATPYHSPRPDSHPHHTALGFQTRHTELFHVEHINVCGQSRYFFCRDFAFERHPRATAFEPHSRELDKIKQ